MPFPWDRPRSSQRIAVRSARSRRARLSDRAKVADRRLAIEPLEQRQLLAVVPSLLADLRTTGTGSSNPHSFVDAGSSTFFAANDGVAGTELWKTDGTTTTQVKDIRTGSSSSNPQSLVNMGGVLYFSASNGTTTGANGTELWRSDGTDAGTWMVKDIAAGTTGSSPTSLTVVGDTLYFLADNGTNGTELWRSNGTEAGTVMVKDIHPGALGSGADDLTAFDGKVFFSADNGTNGAELWSSDGTETGTQMVVDLRAGVNPSYPYYLTELNGSLYFQADDGLTGAELWRTDGTELGTELVKDIYGGADPVNGTPFPSYPYALTTVNDTLFFLANDGLHGNELWKTDGTEDGTVLVRDINTVAPDPFGPTDSSGADYLTNLNGVLYFSANDGIYGAELWKSTGTELGTVMVKDINPGANGSSPTGLVNLVGALYFSANNGANGYELWRSRGTSDTTKMVQDIQPLAGSSTPQEMNVAGDSLYFSADDGTHGREPWYIGPNAAPTDMALVPAIVPENRDLGALVGTLSTVDPDTGDEFTYRLPVGYGDNDKFYVDGDQLKTQQNIQSPTTFTVYVEVRDIADNSYFEWFNLQLGSIYVTPSAVAENAGIGTKVGDLSSAIGGVAQSGVTYSLYAAGDKGDNASFTVEDKNFDGAYEVYTNAVFNYEADHSYTIAVQAQGSGGTYWTYEEITIVDVNEAPVATNDLYNTPAGTAITVDPSGVLDNDTDPDVYWPATQVLHGVVVGGPSHGTLSLHYYTGTTVWDGGFTWTPNSGWLGGDTFTYQAVDDQTPGLLSNVATVRINSGPVGQDDAYAVDEDTTLNENVAPGVLGNDWDYDGDAITATKISDPTHGSLTFNSNGTFTYIPVANYFGTDSFTYKASDGNTFSAPVTVNLTVRPVNDPPVSYDDSYTNLGDQVLTKSAAEGVLVNDILHDVDILVNPSYDSLHVTAYTQPTSGAVTVADDGSFVFTPVVGYTGTVTFTYTVSDSFGDSDPRQGVVTIVCQPMTANVLVNVQTTLWEGWDELPDDTLKPTGRVTIPRDSDPRLQGMPIEVYLTSDSTRLILPEKVVVPANVDYVDFTFDIVDDLVINDVPYESITITARARGLMPGTKSVVVHDNEPYEFVFARVNSPQRAGVEFEITVTPKNKAGEIIPTLVDTIPMYAESSAGVLSVAVHNSPDGLPFDGSAVTIDVAVLSAGSNVRLVVDDGMGHIGRSNQFEVNTGEMVKLVFDALPTDVAVGQPFQVTVSAVDEYGYPVSSYNEPLYLGAWTAGGTASPVVITEISDQTTDYVEIQNVSANTLSVQGWKVVANDSSSGDPNAVHTSKLLSGSMVADEVRYWTDSTTDHYFGTDIAWGSATAKGWVMILDDTGAIRDFLAWGYTQSQIQAMAPKVDGVTVRVGSQWSGAGLDYYGDNATSLQRWGNCDGNVASDFLWYAWQADQKGTANPILFTPFVAAWPVTITPQVAGSFVDGKWTGWITCKQQATNVYLFAADAAGYTTDSRTISGNGVFDANAANVSSGIGAYDPATSTFYLSNTNDSSFANYVFGYGEPGWLPIAGDWNGDGIDTVGLYDPKTSTFYLSNSNESGYADVTLGFGPGGSHTLPVAGDWNGDGTDSIGIYDSLTSTFYLRNTNTTGMADYVFGYGQPGAGWQPVAGDWDGDSFDAVALYDPSTSLYYIKGRLGAGYADVCFGYGQPGANWKPFAGNWTNSGFDSVGVNDPLKALYYERFSNTPGYADKVFGYGAPTWLPIAGDWNGLALVSAAQMGTADASAIDAVEVQPLLTAAADRWSAAGLSAALVDRIRNVNLVVADLSGTALGAADGNTIYIDSTAAGHGWFVDSTPADDVEYDLDASTGALVAADPAAADRMDLLTVVSHELGHVAGLDDLAATADSLMAAVLTPGLRRGPGTAELDALLADPEQDWL